MLNEEHDKSSHWKNKLDKLENLPSETFNKEMAWNRLHKRLQGEPRRKKIYWYWAAASIILLIFFTPFLTRHNSKTQNTRPGEFVDNAEKIIVPGPIDDNNNPGKIVNTDSVIKLKIAAIENKSNTINQILIKNKPVENIRVSHAVNIQLPIETITKSLKPVDSTSNVVVVSPVKKQLKVVHINELGDPVEEPPGVARNGDNHSFQLKFASQEIFVNPPATARTTGFAILKTKTPN